MVIKNISRIYLILISSGVPQQASSVCSLDYNFSLWPCIGGTLEPLRDGGYRRFLSHRGPWRVMLMRLPKFSREGYL
jgi:hypothetical protein